MPVLPCSSRQPLSGKSKPIIATRQARKPYRCHLCGAEIRPGQYYRRVTTPRSGTLETMCECLVCRRDLPKTPDISFAKKLHTVKVPRSTYDLDEDHVTLLMITMYGAGALAWDYADTVLDLASQMRLSQTRQLSRSVRELHGRYEAFTARSLSMFDKRRLTEIGQLIETAFGTHFSRLSSGLDNELAPLGLQPTFRYLVKAVQQAMTVLDAMRHYDAKCADWLTSQRLPTQSILAAHFNSLYTLLPQFAGDAYNPASPTRDLTARILCNELVTLNPTP